MYNPKTYYIITSETRFFVALRKRLKTLKEKNLERKRYDIQTNSQNLVALDQNSENIINRRKSQNITS